MSRVPLRCTYDELHERALEAADELMAPGVQATWVGLRRRGGRWRKETVIVVAVRHKGALGDTRSLPTSLPVGRRSIGVDVVQLEGVVPQCAIGDGVVAGGRPGTLGALGRFGGAEAVLTAGHVAGWQGAWWQCGAASRRVRLHTPFVAQGHVLDLAVLDAQGVPPANLPGLPNGAPLSARVVGAQELLGTVPDLHEVWSAGATSGWRSAVVAGAYVQLQPGSGAPWVFDGDQVLATRTDLVLHAGRGASAPGDSGKLWRTATGRPLGLHWGGTVRYDAPGARSRYAFATYAYRAQELGFTFVG